MDARFGIYGVENPHPPFFVNFGGQGRPGEGGGTWGAAQGPGGEAQREGAGIRLLLADGNPALH